VETVATGQSYDLSYNNAKKVVADSRGWIHVVMAYNGAIYYTRYRPGTGWSGDTCVYNSDSSGYPGLALDSNGTRIHLIWQAKGENGRQIYYMKCDPTPTGDGGWDAGPTCINSDNTSGYNHQWPSIACSPGGHVHAVWADQCSSPTFQAIGYREYSDGMWQDMLRLDSSSTEGYLAHNPAVAAGRDSSLAVVWCGDHIYCKRLKSGTWRATEQVDPNGLTSDSDNADVAINPVTGNVHVAWVDSDSGQQTMIWHRCYDYIASSWAPIDTISGNDSSACNPSICATVNGRVGVV
jgi:hypothetical protein